MTQIANNNRIIKSQQEMTQPYLNSLPDDIQCINLRHKYLSELPDLSRFHSLKTLYCDHNSLTNLPPLSPTLEDLYCNNNRLTSLPPLPGLKRLYCEDNELIRLPSIDLDVLWCQENKLTTLPNGRKPMSQFNCYGNPICEFIGEFIQGPYGEGPYGPIIQSLQKNIQTLNNFRYLYYSLKFKKRFRDWLWIKVREPKIREQYSTANLLKLLEKDDLEQVLDTW